MTKAELCVHSGPKQLRDEAGARQVDGARIALAENGGGFQDGEESGRRDHGPGSVTDVDR
ncbi:hypothetical protein [Amycolatopsis sp. GM8]|uniref:hypothetical protein n=1 Tax=Amycolatopsis sp. GM8 TaxID=2896530 RepID=UPI001F18861B|nr:hypothetical protein [Amycolatopsis sp. GM8]